MLGFVARQPIFDAGGHVSAYELLFRTGPENVFGGGDLDVASRSVINDSLEVYGLETLTGGRRAFVNVTRQVLVEGGFRRLPARYSVLELLETVTADEQVLAACAAARRDGYLIALDDFVLDESSAPLLDHADFVKVDFLATTVAQRAAWVPRLRRYPLHLLAEKVETPAQYEEALRTGFTHFQGFYFQRPEMLSARAIDPQKRAALRLVGELLDARTPFERLDSLVRRESKLCERLLADLNGAVEGRTQVASMREARRLLGDKSFRRWASMVALAMLGDDRPAEFTVTGLVRARFAEQLARTAHLDEGALFLAGMLSATDALLGRPLADVLACLEPPREARAALHEPDSRPGLALALVLAYERGDWTGVLLNADALEVDEDVIPECFRDALAWVHEVYPH